MTILGQIGNTPMLKLRHVIENPDVAIYVKCEYLNPGGSIKDRMALRMIEEAENAGELKSGGTIVDQSTGNTGPALAFVGAVKGYKVHLFLPTQMGSSYNPEDRIRIARIYGCTVEPVDLISAIEDQSRLTPLEKAAAHVAFRMKHCYELTQRDPNAWWSNQLCNMHNADTHRDTTGVEIVKQLQGRVDAWVTSVGTGGTLMGVGETLRKHNQSVVIAGVLPDDDPRIDWVQTRVVHSFLKDYGLPEQKFIIESILDQDLLDQKITVRNEDAVVMAGRLAREEGLFCGMSSGANVFAAIQMAKEMKKGSNIVTVLVDNRHRYFAEHPNEHYVV